MNHHDVSATLATELNASCFCMTLDRSRLVAELTESAPHGIDWGTLAVSHPHLFASVPTFVSARDMAGMTAAVEAIERVSRMPNYVEHALGGAPDIARHDFGQCGALMGYDFHITGNGPKLIEINTNAGGAFLNAVLRDAQRACCKEVEPFFGSPSNSEFADRIVAMFRAEFRNQFPDRQLRTIAIVDEAPGDQYLYPEFLLARATLEAAGIQTLICDPSELALDGSSLKANGVQVDLVYNRLVDFTFEDRANAALRAAYLAGAIAVTPNPRVHAILANKRNLVTLSDAKLLAEFGVTPSDIEALHVVPRTVLLNKNNAAELWAQRKDLFFKPLSGHGGKAVYRGDKLTKATWEHIISGNYIAQQRVAPGSRSVETSEGRFEQKMDVRLYTYDAQVIMAAARVYQGQTTNFRTPGGGFAPLFVI